MELDKLCKIVSILEGEKEISTCSDFWIIGKKYYIETVTKYYTGELVSISNQELILKDAAWIADTGRLNEAMKDSNKFSEVEPYASPIVIGRGAIVGAQEIMSIATSVK